MFQSACVFDGPRGLDDTCVARECGHTSLRLAQRPHKAGSYGISDNAASVALHDMFAGG